MSRATISGLALHSRVSRTFEIAATTLVGWCFAGATAAALFFDAFKLWHGDLKAATPLSIVPSAFSAGAGEAQPWGLSFAGSQGMALAAAGGVAVLIAMAMTMMFASGPRRLGLMMMVAWAGLWSADAVVIVAKSWNHGWWQVSMPFLAATLALFVVTAAMAHRMSRLWRIPVSI